MQVKDAKGTDFALLFLNAFRQFAAESNSNAAVQAMFKPRGNIMGVLLWDLDLHVAVYVIPAPTIPDMFYVVMSQTGEHRSDIDRSNNLLFEFREGTRWYEYTGFDMNKNVIEVFRQAIEDIINFFDREERPAEFAQVVAEKAHYYKV